MGPAPYVVTFAVQASCCHTSVDALLPPWVSFLFFSLDAVGVRRTVLSSVVTLVAEVKEVGSGRSVSCVKTTKQERWTNG
jgi:hypothetical protein